MLILWITRICERAEIGKQTGLKILRSLTPCGFKSHRSHHLIMKKLILIFGLFFNFSFATDLEKNFKDFILDNPEVILESLENYERKKLEILEQENKEKINDLKSLLYEKTDLYSGDGASPNIIIEFLDYNCSYCKLLHKNIIKLIKEKNVKVIYKNFPILSNDSIDFAKIAIILSKQNNEIFNNFHNFLLSSKKMPTLIEVENFLSNQSIDFKKIKEMFEDEFVINSLELHKKIALELKLQGTPALIINDKLFFGYLDYDEIVKELNI